MESDPIIKHYLNLWLASLRQLQSLTGKELSVLRPHEVPVEQSSGREGHLDESCKENLFWNSTWNVWVNVIFGKKSDLHSQVTFSKTGLGVTFTRSASDIFFGVHFKYGSAAR